METPSHLFDRTCTIKRRSTSVDSGGGPKETFADLYTNVACRLVPRTGFESPKYGRESNTYDYSVYLSGTIDVLETDRIVVAGLFLNVQSVIDFDSIGVLKRADCELEK